MGRLDVGGLGGEQEAAIRYGDDQPKHTPENQKAAAQQSLNSEGDDADPLMVNPNIQRYRG